MKTLQICHKTPFPTSDGGSVCCNNITELLSTEKNDTLHLIAFNTNKQKGLFKTIPQAYIQKHSAEYLTINLNINIFQALLNLLSKKSFNIERFNKKEMHYLISKKINENNYDLVIIESLFMMPYLNTIRKYFTGKVVYRSHNIEFEILETRANEENNFLKKWYLNLLANKMKRYELIQSFKTDGILAISNYDKNYYKKINKNVKCIFFPFSFKNFIASSETIKIEKPNFYFIGVMNWEPNIKAVKYIEQEIYPLLKEHNFTCSIYIGGKYMPENWKSRSNDILKFVGEIDNIDTFLKDKHVLVSPLFTGGGLKIKMIEALAMGKNIITNSDSLKSLPINEHDIAFVANNPLEFAIHIINLGKEYTIAYKKTKNIAELINRDFIFLNNLIKIKEFLS